MHIQVMDTSAIQFTVVPKGSILKFDKAVQANRAVSGSKYVYLLGAIFDGQSKSETPIIFLYATFKSICIDQPCDYWEL